MKRLVGLIALLAVLTGLLLSGLAASHTSSADPSVAPTVATNATTNIEETTATLNGMVVDDGGEACQYCFEYDIDSGEPYAYNTTWTGNKTSGQSFNGSVSNLTKGTKYYFRAQARNSAGTGSGSELSFLTKPDAPTNFSASSAGPDRIDLSWTKGDGAQNTTIMRKQGGYPADKDDGTQVYFDTGTSTSGHGLTHNTTYYYRAWSYVEDSEQQWSDDYAEAWATTDRAEVTVSVDAPDAVAEGSDFIATVRVTNVTNMASYQFWISYDPDVIEVTNVTSGLIDSTTVPNDSWVLAPPGTQGLMTALGDISSGSASGSGYLCEIHFHVVGSPGDSSNMTFPAGWLTDNLGYLIPGVDWLGDSVQVNAPVIVSVAAPDEVAEVSNFTASVNITGVTNLDSYQFDLSYNTSVIKVLGIEDAGKAEDGTQSTLVDTDKSWTANEWIGMYCNIVARTGFPQIRQITGNNATTLTVDPNWDPAYGIPNDTSIYHIQTTEADQVSSPGMIDSTTVPVDMWGFSPSGTPGTIRILGNLPGASGVNGSGYLCEVHFHVVGSPGDSSNITLSEGILFDNTGENEIPVAQWLGGSVYVSGFERGDANEDGVVDMSDVTKVERIILELDPPTPSADANEDGSIDMADVTKIERIILGLD